MRSPMRIGGVVGFVVLIVGALPAFGSFHLMQIEQVIGGVNGDTSAQAIQLRMRQAGQQFVSQSQVCLENAAGMSPILIVDMETDVASSTRVLIASANFPSNTTPMAVPNFTMVNLIPPSHFAAGTLTFRQDSVTPCTGGIYWRLSWGGGGYTGSGSVIATPLGNDADGNANPPFAGSLPSTSLQALQFTGIASALSTNNAAQYAVTAGAAVFINNAGTNFTVTGPPTPTGACCDDGSGVCMNGVTQAACEGGNDRYGGDGSTCATINPACTGPTGACCEDSTGTCTEAVTQIACEGSGRRYGGNTSTCGNIDPPCVPPLSPPLQIALELIAGGGQTAAVSTLASPLGITDAGDGTGRLFIQDQSGLIRVIDAGGNLLKEPMLDLTAPGVMPPLGIDFDPGPGEFIFDERGLLGLAFHPGFESIASPGYGKFYIRYSKPRTSTGSEPCDLQAGATPPRCHEEVLAQYTMLGDPLTSNVADASSEVILFRWDKPQFNHNAGHIEFGPDDMLYISTGDGGGANDGLCDTPPSHGNPPSNGPGGNGQNIDVKLGKMIRIDVDGSNGPGGLYGIPGDNPFAGATPGLDEIYAIGFRNPFRFSFDNGPGGDDALYVADVGQGEYEEVDDVVNGGNYGWAIEEGAHCFVPPCTPLPGCGGGGLIDPISEYTHAEGGLAIVGGYVYRGAVYPQLQGKYIYGDFSANFGPTGRLYYFDLTGPEALVRKEFFLAPSGAPFGQFLKGFGRDADGELYVAASDVLGPSGTTGVIYKIVPPPPSVPVWDPATNPIPWPNNNPEAATRSLKFRVSVPAAQTATGTPPQFAIKVTMVDLHHPRPANLAAQAPPNFTVYDTRLNGVCVGGSLAGHHCDMDSDCPSSTCGSLALCTADPACPSAAACTLPSNNCARWVGKPATFLESQDSGVGGGVYQASRLQCTPYYSAWENEGDITVIGLVVVGAEIAPSSEYSVQVYSASCKGQEESCANVSAPVTMYTRRSGDSAPNFNPPAGSTQPDALDVAAVVNKLKNLPGALVKAITQLQPNLPEQNADVNALDIVAVVDAVRQVKYAFSGPCACPSTVTCGLTACPSGPAPCVTAYGAGAQCVKTCVGGANIGDPCINNSHCPGSTCGAGFCRDRCGRCSP